MPPTVCIPARGGLLGQLFRRIGIGVHGAQRFRPRPIATRSASLLSPKQQEAIGAVTNQSPAWGADTASNLAWSSGSLFEDQTSLDYQ